MVRGQLIVGASPAMSNSSPSNFDAPDLSELTEHSYIALLTQTSSQFVAYRGERISKHVHQTPSDGDRTAVRLDRISH
jgi:hypothetical protein